MTIDDVNSFVGKTLGGRPGWLPERYAGPATRTAMSAILGGLAGRFLVSPAIGSISPEESDEKARNRNLTFAGAGLGAMLSGVPAYFDMKTGTPAFGPKQAAYLPFMPPDNYMSARGANLDNSLYTIATNPYMGLADKLDAQYSVLQASKNTGGGITAGGLVNAAGATMMNALPIAAAAVGVSKLLGLPSSVTNKGLMGGLLAGAFKTYLDFKNT